MNERAIESEREGTMRARKRQQEEEQQLMFGSCETLCGFYLLYGVRCSPRNS